MHTVAADLPVGTARPKPFRLSFEEQPPENVDWLVPLIASGNQAALGKLYDRTRRLVYGLILRILEDPADAEEVTLDVYVQVWRAAANFDSSRGTVRSWLITLARSRAIDRLRSRGKARRRSESTEVLEEVAASDPSPEHESLFSQRRQLVREAVQSLPSVQRRAIELAFFSGMTHSELAAHLNQPLGTVKSHIRMGMLSLREELQHLA